MNDIEVGYIVTKEIEPRVSVGMVIHVEDDDSGRVQLVGKRDPESPWTLIEVSRDLLNPWVSGTLPPGGTFPGVAEIGEALVARQRLLTDQAAARSQRLRELEADHEQFQVKVRDMAIEKAAELGWCTPGLNAALEELGLPGKTRMYDVRVELRQTVTVCVEAEDEEAAERMVDNTYTSRSLVRDYADDHDWTVTIESAEESED